MPDIVSKPPAHRFIFKRWYGFAAGGLGVGSVYLRDGVGLNEENEATLHSIAGWLKAWGKPFVLGGDWQMSADALINSG